MSNTLHISKLFSGGLITNYYCTSKCQHCLYACSPKWDKQYIEIEKVRGYFKFLKSMDCFSIHIGGGEPMLKTETLFEILKVAKEEDIHIQYVETNSSWYKDEKSAIKILKKLRKSGLHTMLVSISPFHNEHIPFNKTKGVIKACHKTGINVFPWIQDFYPEIDSFDDQVTHSLDEYEQKFGKDYLKNIPGRYWIQPGGRAVLMLKNIFPLKQLENLPGIHNGCSELTDTSHFHIDLFGNYIPGLCSGLAIKAEDLGQLLDKNKYPILSILYSEGVYALLEFTRHQYNFEPKDQYLNKCDLCLDIRRFLSSEMKQESIELQPKQFYEFL